MLCMRANCWGGITPICDSLPSPQQLLCWSSKRGKQAAGLGLALWLASCALICPLRCALVSLQAIKQGEQAAKLGVGDPKLFAQQRTMAEKNVKVGCGLV